MRITEILFELSFIFIFGLRARVTNGDTEYCGNLLKCNTKLIAIYEQCIDTIKMFTGDMCRVNNAFRDLQIMQRHYDSNYLYCIQRNLHYTYINKLPDQTKGSCSNKVSNLHENFNSLKCWEAFDILKKKCNELEDCCFAAKSCQSNAVKENLAQRLEMKYAKIIQQINFCKNSFQNVQHTNSKINNLSIPSRASGLAIKALEIIASALVKQTLPDLTVNLKHQMLHETNGQSWRNENIGYNSGAQTNYYGSTNSLYDQNSKQHGYKLLVPTYDFRSQPHFSSAPVINENLDRESFKTMKLRKLVSNMVSNFHKELTPLRSVEKSVENLSSIVPSVIFDRVDKPVGIPIKTNEFLTTLRDTNNEKNFKPTEVIPSIISQESIILDDCSDCDSEYREHHTEESKMFRQKKYYIPYVPNSDMKTIPDKITSTTGSVILSTMERFHSESKPKMMHFKINSKGVSFISLESMKTLEPNSLEEPVETKPRRLRRKKLGYNVQKIPESEKYHFLKRSEGWINDKDQGNFIVKMSEHRDPYTKNSSKRNTFDLFPVDEGIFLDENGLWVRQQTPKSIEDDSDPSENGIVWLKNESKGASNSENEEPNLTSTMRSSALNKINISWRKNRFQKLQKIGLRQNNLFHDDFRFKN